jgi:hypothetical protein
MHFRCPCPLVGAIDSRPVSVGAANGHVCQAVIKTVLDQACCSLRMDWAVLNRSDDPAPLGVPPGRRRHTMARVAIDPNADGLPTRKASGLAIDTSASRAANGVRGSQSQSRNNSASAPSPANYRNLLSSLGFTQKDAATDPAEGRGEDGGQTPARRQGAGSPASREERVRAGSPENVRASKAGIFSIFSGGHQGEEKR